MASGKAIGATLVLGGGGATAGAAMGGAFSSKSEEQTQESPRQNVPQPSIVPEQEPADIDVFATADLTNTNYSSSILSKIKESNLSSIVKSVSATKKDQTKSWWKWKWEKKFKKNKPSAAADAPFNTVTQAYKDEEDTISLNQACEKAYRKVAAADYVFTTTLLDNIKKFCTKTLDGIDVSEPKSTPYSTAKQTTDNDYGLGVLTNAELAKKLVDATPSSTNNDLWFKWAFEKRVKDTKVKASSTFSSVTNETTLKTACDNAYKKNRHELTDVEVEGKSTVLKDLGQYCASTPLENLTAPNTVPSTEPSGVQTFATTDVFTNEKNKDYHQKVLSIIKKTSLEKIVKHNHPNNRTWWDWAFKKVWEAKKATLSSKLDPLFTSITKGYSDKETEKTALNQACHEAYKQDSGKYVVTTDNKLLKSISVFCTKGDSTDEDLTEPEPTLATTADATSNGTYKTGLFTKESNKSKLVMVTGGNNNLWWEWAFHNLYTADNNNDGTRTTEFKKATVTSAYSANASTNALNQVCDTAYKKGKGDLWDSSQSDAEKQLLKDIKKYCSPTKEPATLEKID